MSKILPETTGRSSSRTPFKHWILNAELGRLCGIFASPIASQKVHAKASPFTVVDLCAGDGAVSDEYNSSPAIICKHLGWASQRGVDVRAVMIEKLGGTFELLTESVPAHEWVELLNIDAREWSERFTTNQAVFIHSDPNDIHNWPITDDLLRGLSATTTMLATLGCNVGGLKRLNKAHRMLWFDNVAACLKSMPRYHDAILIALDGDSSQWAYLLRVPAKWSNATQNSIRTAGSKFTDYGLSIAAMRDSQEQFCALQNRLFLTAKERGE